MPSRALLVRVVRREMRSVVNKARGKEDREWDDMVEWVCWCFGILGGEREDGDGDGGNVVMMVLL